MTAASAQAIAEQAARASYGRLLAILIAGSRDIAAAEDALASAFEAALQTWPARGIPANPDAWLLTAARNRLHNARRHVAVQTGAEAELIRRAEALAEVPVLPDERLRLMFLCAHPAIDEASRTPLMLQCVLGLDAARIARAFLVTPAAMGQRLTRAKARVRDAGLRFVLSDADLTSDRLTAVLDAIYAAFGLAWDAPPGAPSQGLTAEALFLARLIVELLPAEPEPRGLLALMLYCEARRPARRPASGSFVPLSQQDARLWRRDMIIEAETLLTAASRHGRFGRYLCEAAIQSVHIQRPITGQTNHQALELLYGLLLSHSPSTGTVVGLAAVLLETAGPARALALLDSVPADRAARYQPWWVIRARALQAAGHPEQSARDLARAMEMTDDPALRAFLQEQAKDA